MKIVQVGVELSHAAAKRLFAQALEAVQIAQWCQYALKLTFDCGGRGVVNSIAMSRLFEHAQLDMWRCATAKAARRVLRNVLQDPAMDFLQVGHIESAL